MSAEMPVYSGFCPEPPDSPMKLVLASTSPYRKALLEKLGLPFSTCASGVDESRRPGENVEAYVGRLALEKARAAAATRPGALIIGSDQACALDGRILGKPGGHEAARRQLRDCSGRSVDFHTGLALLDSAAGRHWLHVEPFRVRFRPLSDAEIDAYLERERPYDCAGSFKVESGGICLFEALEGRDFNSLIGLPLIALCDLLREAGLNPLLASRPDPR